MFDEDVTVTFEPSAPVTRISVTAIQRLAECQLKYRLTFIDGHRSPVSARGEWSMGRIVHGTLQRLFGLPAATRARTADLYPLVIEEWRAQQGGEYFQWAAKARNIAEGIFKLIPTDVVSVAGAEVPVSAQVAGVTVTGRVDLIYAATDGRRVIADYKSHLDNYRSGADVRATGVWSVNDQIVNGPDGGDDLGKGSRLASPLHPLRIYDLLLSDRYDDPGQEVTIELLGLDPPVREELVVTGRERVATREALETLLHQLNHARGHGEWLGRVRVPGCKTCPRREVCPAAAQVVASNPKLKFRL